MLCFLSYQMLKKIVQIKKLANQEIYVWEYELLFEHPKTLQIKLQLVGLNLFMSKYKTELMKRFHTVCLTGCK